MLSFVKIAAVPVAAIAGSLALAACGNGSGSNSAVPVTAFRAVDARVVVGGAVIPVSALAVHALRFPVQSGRESRQSAPPKGETLYASLFEGDVFSGYDLPQRKPFCQSPPTQLAIVNGIGADKDGNLWLPTQVVGGVGEILSFAPGCGASGPTLSAPTNAGPVGIAFAPDGTKYGLMTYTSASSDSASVEIYPAGATSPAGELTDARLNRPDYVVDGIGTDTAGRVYVTCCANAEPTRFAIRFPAKGNHAKGKKLVLQQMGAPGGSVSFDRNKNMLVPDVTDASLKIYAPPYAGAPATYPLQGTPWQCSLSESQKKIACSNRSADAIDVYAYPSLTFKYRLKSHIYPSVSVAGVAFSP